MPKTRTPKDSDLTPAEVAEIDAADEAQLRKIIEAAAMAELSTKAAMDADADVTAAKAKLKEVSKDYKDDMKRERSRKRAAYERLESMGKAE
jgi:hypothetical protein